MWRGLALGLAMLCVACQASLPTRVQATLENPEQTGIRWGLVVAEMDGTELIAIKPDDRFTPASNTKIITSMAAYHHLAALETESLAPGTRVYLETIDAGGPPDLILVGGADAMLSDTPDCEAHCLADLADQIAATGLTEIGLIIGDDTHLPFERWGLGWSVEDLQFYYGTAISALSVNDNLVWVEIMPGPAVGDPALVEWQDGDAYLKLDATLVTVDAETKTDFGVERDPGADTVRIYGHVSIETAPIRFPLAIDNPAEFAALRLKRRLEARDISVAGIATRHRPLELIDIPPDPDADEPPALVRMEAPPDLSAPIALLPSAPLKASLERISKDSENLHADLTLRRLGLIEGTGSRAFGVAKLEAFMADAGIAETGYALHGGSGMSVYNRISPRSMVQLLAFAAQQPWFEAWLADQPIGGVDGTLERRFVGTPLEGKIFAKTGTLNGANALSGVMVAKSGKRLLFSILANDRPSTTGSAIVEMDAALAVIAESY